MNNQYKFKMTVWIKSPKQKDGMSSTMCFKFNCYFAHDEETYGNGWSCGIYPVEKQYAEHIIDLRYTKWNITNVNKARLFLKWWCSQYWNGENGSYIVDKIEFEQL